MRTEIMNLETKMTSELIVLKPENESLDATVSKEFKSRVIDLINQGNNFFLLNMSQVDFVDSSGLIALISILKALSINQGDIVLCEVKLPVLNLFNLTRMNNVFKTFASEKEGLEYLINVKKNL
jgi:anti-sigma B factor antagonist